MRVTSFLPFIFAAFTFTARAAEPDFAAAHSETIEALRNFVRDDTTNPPGNETRGAEFLKAILEHNGIPAETVGRDPARGNLIARLKGSGKKKPLLLMGHLDTVGIERSQWTGDPLAAIVKDGFIYGRGAADDKCMTTRSEEHTSELQSPMY